MITKTPDYLISECGRPQLRDLDYQPHHASVCGLGKPFVNSDLFMLQLQRAAAVATTTMPRNTTNKLLTRRETLTQYYNRVLQTRILEQKTPPAPKSSHARAMFSASRPANLMDADEMKKQKNKLNEFIRQ